MSNPISKATSPLIELRTSMNRRISNLFHLSYDQRESRRSGLLSNTFEVPLFMSPSRGYENNDSVAPNSFQPSRPALFGSCELGSNTEAEHSRSQELGSHRSSSVYSNSPGIFHSSRLDVESQELASVSSETQDSNDTMISKLEQPGKHDEFQHSRRQRKRKRISQATLRKLHVKARLSIAFGITLLVFLIIYISLAVSGVGTGPMFHAMCIVLLLVLAGVFCHSSISLLMLMRRKKIKVRGRDRWWGFNERKTFVKLHQSNSVRECSRTPDSDKAFPVVMVADEEAALEAQTLFGSVKVVRPPPPVYGNFRGSRRINPNLIFLQRTSPSPTTPTYDEAMQDEQGPVGYQPPQYGSSPVRMPSGQRSSVHPLERERIWGLMKRCSDV